MIQQFLFCQDKGFHQSFTEAIATIVGSLLSYSYSFVILFYGS